MNATTQSETIIVTAKKYHGLGNQQPILRRLPTSNWFNDYPVKGVGPSGPKRIAPKKGDDIVSSAWKHAAARKGGSEGSETDRRYCDTTVFNHLAGISTQTNDAYNGNNTITAPTSTRHLFPNGETAEANCSDSTSSRFTLSLLDNAIEVAKTASPMIQPIRMNGKEYYVCFLHPYQVKDLRTEVNTGKVTWYGVQSNALSGNGAESNPIFTGALGVYNGVVLHESNYIPASPTVATCRRAVFAGANAACVAFGKGDGPNRMTWNEELNQEGLRGSATIH